MARPRKEPEPEAALVTVRCLWPNIWTSGGKLLRGETATIPAGEAEALDRRDAVKIVRDA